MKKGFSLIEAMVSVAIFSLIVVGLLSLVSFILTGLNGQNTLLSDNEQALHVAFTIMREVRNAQTSANGAYPIDTANNQQLIFYSNTGTEVDRINYFIQNGQIKKGVTKPTGTPPIYNLGQEVVTVIQNDVANGANPLFFYYDDAYNGVNGSALAQPVSAIQVKFIKISVSVYNKGGRVGTSNTYTVSAGAAIRSLKTNLGS